MPYSPEKSRMTAEQELDWSQLELDGSLQQVPGIGKKTIETLGNYVDGDFPSGIRTVWQLFGVFLLLKSPAVEAEEHLVAFYAFFSNLGCPPAHLNTLVQAVAVKMSIGFRVPCASSVELLTSSRMSDKATRNLLDQAANGECDPDPSVAFKGAGLGPKSLQKLQQQGIKTTFQVIGKLLSTCDEETHNSPDVFLSWLADVGIASSWRKTVAVAVTELISVGIPISSAAGTYSSPATNPRRQQYQSPLHSIPETALPNKASQKSEIKLRSRIHAMYAQYSPSKLTTDPTFVARTAAKYSYAGGEAALFKTLTAKYGPEPAITSKQPILSIPALAVSAVVIVAAWLQLQQWLQQDRHGDVSM